MSKMKKAIFLLVFALLTAGTFASLAAQQTSSTNEPEIIVSWSEYPRNPIMTNGIAVSEDYAWGAYADGVIRWHKQDRTYRHFTQADGLLATAVTAVVVDQNDHVWFGTASGLSHFDGLNWTHYTDQNELINNTVTAISLGLQGELFVATGASLNIFDGYNWHYLEYSPAIDPQSCLQDYPITDVTIAPNDYIWITLAGNRVCYYDGTIWRWFFQNQVNVNARAITTDLEGNIWFAGVEAHSVNVGRLSPGGEWTVYTADDGLPEGAKISIVIDKQGDVWVGTEAWAISSVSHFDGNSWNNHNWTTGLNSSNIYDLAADSDGSIWTGSTVNRLVNGDTWHTYLAGLPFGPGSFIPTVYVDQNDNVWISVFRQGVVMFDGQVWHHYMEKDGLAADNVYAILRDDEGNVWFACYRDQFGLVGVGLSKFDGNNWETITTADGLASNAITALALDDNGSVWASHQLAGISQQTGSGWTNYNEDDGLLNNRTNTIFAQNGLIWVGHENNGVSMFDGLNWQTFDSDDGLDGHVSDFAVDQDDQLLAVVGGNVFQFDGMEWLPGPTPPFSPFDTQYLVVDQHNHVWFTSGIHPNTAMYDGVDWFLWTGQQTGISPVRNKMAINNSGNTIWFESTDGIARLRIGESAEYLFLPLIAN